MLHRKIALAIAGLLLATLVLPAAAQETIDEARARREAVQSEACLLYTSDAADELT